MLSTVCSSELCIFKQLIKVNYCYYYKYVFFFVSLLDSERGERGDVGERGGMDRLLVVWQAGRS